MTDAHANTTTLSDEGAWNLWNRRPVAWTYVRTDPLGPGLAQQMS